MIIICEGSLTGRDHTAEMTSSIIVPPSFLFAKQVQISDSLALCYPFVVVQECEAWNALAQRSPNKVGGFPLGAVNPAARQTLYGSFGLPGCGLVCTAQTGPMASVYLPSPCYLDRPSPSLLENKKLGVKTWPLVRVHSVRVDINHSFMEVSVGVYETCVLLVFLFLTQITEQYLDMVTAEE